MLPDLLAFVAVLPAQVLCLLPLWHHMKYTPARTMILLAGSNLLLLPAAAAIAFRFSIPYIYVMIPLILLLFLIGRLLLTVPFCKVAAVYAAVFALMEILSNAACAIEASYHPEFGAYTRDVPFALLRLTLYTAAACLLAWPFNHYARELVDSLDLPGVWYMTLPFSAILIALCLLQKPLMFSTLFVNNIFRAFLSMILFTLIIWSLLCVMFYLVVSTILSAARQRERVRMLETQESQYAAQRRYMEDSARARHDFRQSVRTMKELFHSRNYDALGSFIDKYYDSLPQLETIRYCGNAALNAVLNFYAGKAREEKIRTVFKIDLPDLLEISDVDICTIVGNILENALLACLDIPQKERWIHLTMLVQNGDRLFLVAGNSHSGKLRRKNGLYLSTRQHGEGLGLRSVMTTAARHGGVAEFSHDAKEFVSNVMLPLDRP